MQSISPLRRLTGQVTVPGDKSISHRSILLASLAEKPVRIRNFLRAEDCLSTLRCMQALGVKADRLADSDLLVEGNGLYGLTEPSTVLDAGNSGTTMRLLAGILAGQPFMSVLTGDASLCQRPMARILAPLSRMGGRVYGREQSRYAPLVFLPGEGLQGLSYHSPVASAQVKSALLLAGLYAGGPTRISEPVLSRDHTELMLETFGVRLERQDAAVTIYPCGKLAAPGEIVVPGDISSAAFWLVAATLIPGSRLVLPNVGVNPTRTGILDMLTGMGARITLANRRYAGREPVADLEVEASRLVAATIGAEILPRLIDEIPVLAVAALFAKGRTIISGAGELRVKETDRLRALVTELGKMGAQVAETADGLVIEGPQPLQFAACDAHADHRIALALAVAALAGKGAVISGAECVAISYPGFFTEVSRIGQLSSQPEES
ncbi:MAG TPA: 3-phosphoshikimate 1-carboxyvinyltransferase [Selenomonadales bacterium]|nr:3-phosphoshikimate 1-carboxyvinyltransferase [Selenomonadales bacterium]